MPDSPFVKLLEATLTAWSECVPVPNENIIIIALPNRRGMKKSALSFIFRADQTPMTTMPSR
jgi:hypothetical protein